MQYLKLRVARTRVKILSLIYLQMTIFIRKSKNKDKLRQISKALII